MTGTPGNPRPTAANGGIGGGLVSRRRLSALVLGGSLGTGVACGPRSLRFQGQPGAIGDPTRLAGSNVAVKPLATKQPWLRFEGGPEVPAGVALAVDWKPFATSPPYRRAPRVLELDVRGNITTQGFILSSGSMESPLPKFMIGAMSDLSRNDPIIVALANVSPQNALLVGTASTAQFAISESGILQWGAMPLPSSPGQELSWDARITYPGSSSLAILADVGIAPANSPSFVPLPYGVADAGLGGQPTNLELRANGRSTSTLTLSGPLTLDTQPIGGLQVVASTQAPGHQTVAVLGGYLDGGTNGKRGGRLSAWTKSDNGEMAERVRIDEKGVLSVGGGPSAATARSGEIELTGAGKGILLRRPDGQRYRLSINSQGALEIVQI